MGVKRGFPRVRESLKKRCCLCQDMTVLLSVENRLRSADEMSSLLLSPSHEKTRRSGNSGWHLLGALSLHSHPSTSQMRKQAGTLRCVFKFKWLKHEFVRKPVSYLPASDRNHGRHGSREAPTPGNPAFISLDQQRTSSTDRACYCHWFLCLCLRTSTALPGCKPMKMRPVIHPLHKEEFTQSP